jgi:hypothetical protein
MSTLINTIGIETITKEYAALQERCAEISRIKNLLSTTPPEQLVFEVVMPSNRKEYVEKITRSGDLRSIIMEVTNNWNANKPKAYRKKKPTDTFVFVVFGDHSVAVPGDVVEKLSGIKTNNYEMKFSAPTIVVPTKRDGWT